MSQAIIAATDYLANSFWDKIHNPNPEKRLNETAYYDKVGLGFKEEKRELVALHQVGG